MSAPRPTSKPDAYSMSIDSFYSLPITVQNKFNELFKSTTIQKKNLVKRVYSSLLEFPEAVQLEMIDTFKSRCLKNMFLQKSVLFMDIMKQRDFQRNEGKAQSSSQASNPSNQSTIGQSHSSSQSVPKSENTLPINALFQPRSAQTSSSQIPPSSQASLQTNSTSTYQNNQNTPSSQVSQSHYQTNQITPSSQGSQPQPSTTDGKDNIEHNSTPVQNRLERTTFQIPEQLVGYVIGKGGKIIGNIRNRSGAQIKIADRVDGRDGRDITVIGIKSQLEMAVNMMNERISIETQENERDSGHRNDRNDRRGRYDNENSHGGQGSSGGYGSRRGRDWGGDYGRHDDYHHQRPNRRARYRY